MVTSCKHCLGQASPPIGQYGFNCKLTCPRTIHNWNNHQPKGGSSRVYLFLWWRSMLSTNAISHCCEGKSELSFNTISHCDNHWDTWLRFQILLSLTKEGASFLQILTHLTKDVARVLLILSYQKMEGASFLLVLYLNMMEEQDS